MSHRSLLIDLLVKLYPRSWLDRYEDEFRAMLEQYRPNLWEGLDIVRGALDAQRRIPMVQIGGSNGQARLPLAFAGALVMPVIVVFVIFVAPLLSVEEDALEFLVLLAPTALLPLVIALHRRFKVRLENTIYSRLVLITGMVGTLALPAAFPIQWVLNQIADGPVEWAGSVYLTLIAFLGIWMVLVCSKALADDLLPKALSVTGMLGGAGWVLWISTILLSMLGVDAPFLAMLGLFFGLLVVPGWSLWAALWLLRRRSPDPADAAAAMDG